MTEPAFGTDAASTNASLDRWAAEISAKAERYDAMRQEIQATTSTEESADGSVGVTVDSGGAIVDLRFTEELKRLPASRMAEIVLATMRRAQAGIADQVADIVENRVGDDPQTAGAMIETYRQRFPDPEPEDPGDGPRSRIGELDDEDAEEDPGDAERRRRQRRRNDDDDDEFGGSVLDN